MFDSAFALLLALVLLDSLDGVSDSEYFSVHVQIEALTNSMSEADLGYFECVLDVVNLRRAS